MDTFILKVIIPTGIYFVKNVFSCNFSNSLGQLTILPHHIDIMTDVSVCPLVINENNHILYYAVTGGNFSFNQKENTGTMLVDAIENSTDIDLNRALEAKNNALEILNNKTDVSERESMIAEIKLKRALNRISVKGIKE